MWYSDGDGRAGCSSLAYERRRQCPMWNSVKWNERTLSKKLNSTVVVYKAKVNPDMCID